MATLRERPFVSKPSDALKARMEQARQGGFFVVQTPGPTSFVLKSDQESKKLKVNIGSVHSCSCGAREQPCVHVAFVLLRVFRLEPTDQRCWQASLTDSELEALVDSRARAAAMRRLEARQWAAAPPQSDSECDECDPLDVPRRPIDDTADPDPCPICYEDIGPEDDEAGELDWCRRSCGKSLHRRCFARWAEHQTAIGQKLSCPHCRGEWASGPAEVMRPRPTAETVRADYDLLLTLSNPHSGLGGRASVAYDVPSAATRDAHGSASSGVASRRDERRVDVSLAARVVAYDAAQIAPLLAELNEIEAEAQRDRAAVGAAKRPGAVNGTVAVTSGTVLPTPPPLMDIAGQGISIGRAAGGEMPASLRAIGRSASGGGGGSSAAFSSAVGRPWQQSRAPASVAAERIAAERMAAGAGIGFEDINLIGNSLGVSRTGALGMARSGPLARTEAVLPRTEAVPMDLPNLGLPAEPLPNLGSLPSGAREPLTTQPPPLRARGSSGAPANPGASLVPPPPDPNTPLGFMDGLVGRAFSGAAAR
eukprot:jgi/Chrpa1/9782/Chrysochromulina_OHIO_Genome00020075-RA